MSNLLIEGSLLRVSSWRAEGIRKNVRLINRIAYPKGLGLQVLPLGLLHTHREDVGVLHSVGAFAFVKFPAEVSGIDKTELPIQFILGDTDKGVIAPRIRRVDGEIVDPYLSGLNDDWVVMAHAGLDSSVWIIKRAGGCFNSLPVIRPDIVYRKWSVWTAALKVDWDSGAVLKSSDEGKLVSILFIYRTIELSDILGPVGLDRDFLRSHNHNDLFRPLIHRRAANEAEKT
jgi:hypothetical protein